MQHVHLLCVGSLKKSWASEACSVFMKRLTSSFDFSITEIPASKANDPTKQVSEENEKILKALSKATGQVWVLDERGEQISSEQFATCISRLRDDGTSLIFVIGGAYGLGDAVRERADVVLSLSKMTLPHELARVVFLEQLYRGASILQGSGYHHH